MTQLVTDYGYPSVTVANVIALAGVSRATFYEQFSDKEQCLVAALAPAGERLQSAVSRSVGSAPAGRRAATVLAALVEFADSHAAIARLALCEPLAAGQRALDARDETIAALALIIEQGYEHAPPDTLAPDLPTDALVGGVSRMLASLLGRSDAAGLKFTAELSAWLASYRTPLAAHRWRNVSRRPPRPRSLSPRALQLRRPADPARDRRASRSRFDEEQRSRVMFATAELVSRRGFDAVTVADISHLAGVESPAIYRLFAGKGDALRACGELLFGQVMAASAGAFVVGDRWPEHVLEAARALLQCLDDNHVLAKAAIVGGHSAGACSPAGLGSFAERFGIFLEEGFRLEPARGHPPEVSLQAVTMMVLELSYQAIRAGEQERLSGLVGHVGFIALAPFLGAVEANALLERQCSLDRRDQRAQA